MLINKKKDMTPFDMKQKPSKQYFFLLPIMWLGSFILTRQFNLKIEKKNMDKIKPPYLVIATHQGFSDYYIGPLALFPRRAIYVSDMEGFAAFGKWLYRGLGCIGKRRYVADINVMNNIKYAIDNGQSVVLYPESRHSNVGTTAYIPKNIGRLVKTFGIPLVVLSAKGSYLANPFWDEENTRKVPMKAFLECVYTAEKVKNLSADDIQNEVEKRLFYDEYYYQHKNNILIKDKNRAAGLHKALYQCVKCASKYSMKSHDIYIECENCNSKWQLTEDGWLEPEFDTSNQSLEYETNISFTRLTENDKSKKSIHIPDWYEWCRKQVIDEIEEKGINEKVFSVKVEALPNEYGFVELGEGKLILKEEGFELQYKNVNGIDDKLFFPHKIRESVQTEYNYRGKGMCIVLSTKECCYYLYSNDKDFQVTELQFIGEYLYLKQKNIKHR